MILDSHVHLFNPARPQGVPWPGRLALPSNSERLERIARPLGITGAIHVEASPWAEDNEWVLEATRNDPFIVGVVGNLEPADTGFARKLDHLMTYPKFRGLRYGNLWGRDLGQSLRNLPFQEGLREMARRQLSLDSANPTPQLLKDLLRLSDLVPGLTVILDHLPSMPDPELSTLRDLASRNLYVKVSYIPAGEESAAVERIALMREVFRPRQLLYGSDWPNSAGHWRTYADNFHLLTPPDNLEDFYNLNARRAYRL
jgi:predicted TIM-barrel fold metal-dependent hydrolase